MTPSSKRESQKKDIVPKKKLFIFLFQRRITPTHFSCLNIQFNSIRSDQGHRQKENKTKFLLNPQNNIKISDQH